MNKKTFLCTTIASTMLIAGITFPMSNAAFESAIKRSSFNTQEIGNAITIEFNNTKNVLTRKDIVELVNTKFDAGDENLVEQVVNAKGEVIPEEDTTTTIGTGAKVTLNKSGKKTFTIEVFGDVTEDGKITYSDATSLYNSIYNKEELNKAKQMAGDVTGTERTVTYSDATSLYNSVYSDTTNGTKYVLESKMPQEDVEIKMLDVKAELEVHEGVEEVPNKDNVTAVTMLEDGKTIEVEAKLERMEEVEKPTQPAAVTAMSEEKAKWYEVKIGTGIEEYNIEGAEYIVDEEDGQPILILEADEKEEGIPVKIINNKDLTESVDLTIKLIDVDTPDVSAAAKVEDESKNQSLVTVDAESIASGTVSVKTNLNKMDEVNGVKSYKLDLTTVAGDNKEFAANKVAVIEQDGEDGYKTLEVTRSENKTTVVLDASVTAKELKVVNKNVLERAEKVATAEKPLKYDSFDETAGVEGQIKVDKITVNTTASEDTKISVDKIFVAPGAGTGSPAKENTDPKTSDDMQTFNQAFIRRATKDIVDPYQNSGDSSVDITSKMTNNELVISGPRNLLYSYVLNDNYKVKTSDSSTNLENVEQGGKKYYGLVINTGKVNANELAWTISDENAKCVQIPKAEGDLYTTFLSGIVSGESYTFKGNEILVWLDADKDETTIELRTKVDSVNEKDYPEVYKLTVKFKDTSDVIDNKVSVKLPATTNNQAVTNNDKTVKKIPNVVIDGAGSKITVSPEVRIAGLKELDNENHKYYALIVKTGADRDVLKIKYPSPSKKELNCADEDLSILGEGVTLDDDEILVWVRADSTAAQSYTISNINNPNITFTLIIQNANKSDLVLGGTALTATTEKDQNKIKTFLENDYENYASNVSFIYNKFTLNTVAPTGNYGWDRTFKLQGCLSQLKEFDLYEENGKWFPLMLTVNDVSRIKEGWTDETHVAYIDRTNATAFGAVNTKQALLWVNLADEEEIAKVALADEETIDIVITSQPDNAGISETVVVRLEVEDKSAGFSEEVKENNEIPTITEEIGKLFVKEGEKEHVEKNVSLVQDITFDDSTTLRVKADVKNMDSYVGGYFSASPDEDYVYIPIVLDLGINRQELHYGDKWDGEDNTLNAPEDWKLKETQWLQWLVIPKERAKELTNGKTVSTTLKLTHKDNATQLTETINLKIIVEQCD